MSFSNMPILSLIIWFPILLGFLIVLAGKRLNLLVAKYLALAVAVLSFGAALTLITGFDYSLSSMQFVEKTAWITRFQIYYALGIDGISLWLVILTAFILCVVILSAWNSNKDNLNQYLGAFLILSGLMTGTFCALDGLLFYAFFEATLIPMFVIIGIWGGEKRITAAFKFFLYPFFGSLFMLVAIIYLYLKTGSFDIFAWKDLPLALSIQIPVFLGFLLAFGIKLPMWPVHTWLPDAHVEASTEGSVVLAAIMLKLGGYGFIRFMLPITPDACRFFSTYMIGLSLMAIIYIGLITLVQKDMKKLIAYSSIVHMGFVTMGFFLFQQITIEGAMVQMISHGLISAALFLCVGLLYDRTSSKNIADYGGIATIMPRFSALFVLFSVANCAMPGTSGFVGEVLVIIGAVKTNFWLGIVTASALLLTAAYSLWLVKRVVFGTLTDSLSGLKEIDLREFVILGGLALLIIFIGIYPSWLIVPMQSSIADMLIHVSQVKHP